MASVARKDAKRFSSLNLGTTYKGAKPEAKGAGNKGGFQSLGKIQGKRMPGPAQLPSLRKENAGNDPNVNLVPQAGGGWGMGKEDEIENKEVSSQPSSSSQPVTQSQDVQAIPQQSTTGREAGVKKEGIWATPEASGVGPASAPPNQHFKKNFPSLEEREARGTKRTITNELHHDSPQVPFNEMDNMSSVPAPTIPPGHYHFAPRQRPPYAAAPSHMGPPYLPRGMPAFRHGMPPPPAEYNHYGHHGATYRGYPPQQQPGPPPNSAAGGQYQYAVPRYHLPPNSSLPHNMDPYQDGQAKLVKSEELKNLELPDEDDDVGGWAGYHEEVDYSKKVVFNDSSDDEESHQEHQQRQPKRKELHDRESTSRETRMQEVPPFGTVEQPHLHADQSSKHLHAATVDLQYFQQHSQSGGGHYPLYYTAHPPQRGYPITVASRPVEKERPHQAPQSDLQPIWQQNRRPKGVPPPESAWGEDKMVTSPAVTQSSTVQSIANEQLESIQQQLEQTTLNDNDSNVTAAISAEKKHVKFHLEQQQQPAAPPAARQPLKIMMRDMKLSARDENDQTSATENFHHGNMGKPPYHHRPNDTDNQHAVNIDRSLQQQQKISAWKAADRGPITTPRTLYEPEGDKSAKKFNALIKQTSSERGKRGSASESTQDGEQVQSPSGDIKILKAEEKQSKGKPTATTPTDDTTTVHNKPQQTSHKNKTGEASATTTKKGSKKERPSFRQYQPPPARDQDEQLYTENKGSSRRSTRQDYNYEQQGDSRSQRRRDRQSSEGKYHSDKRYSDSKHQTEARPHSEGKAQAEGKHHPEGKRQVDGSSRRENRSRKERETSKDPPASTHEQTEQHTATPADVSKEDVSKSEHSQDDKTKQSGKDAHRGGSSSGDTKHRKKNTATSGPAAQKSDSSVSREKSRGRGGRGRNTDDWYYSDDYYNQWYASGGYDDYYYYYDDYNYYSDRRAPSGRQKQQQQQQSYDASKSTSERRDTGGGKKSHQQQQQQTERANRPARTRGGDRKDESSEDKAQQHRTSKDKSREVSGEEVSRSKAAEEADIRDRGRRRDSKQQHQESNVDKKRSSRTAGTKGTAPQSSTTSTSRSSASHDATGRGQSSTTSTSRSSASHDATGRGQSRTSSNKTSTSQDRPQQSDDQQHTTASENSSSKKEPAIKDKAASAKMAIVDINSPTVFVIDEEQTIPIPSTPSENDDFIRVTSKKEKREMKELEKHRQQEKQRKAEEEENKKKQHSTRKSSQKTKHQQQHQLQEQSLPHEDQSLSTNWSTTTTATVSNASIWTESITSLLNEGVNQASYMAAAHSTLMAPGDYQLFPTSSSFSSSSAPLAHLSAAVDSSVAQDLPTSAAQGHSLSESDVKPTGVGRPDVSSAGHGAIRTDLPLSKSHSSASVGGAIGRGRGSSSSRAPGSNRGSSSRDSSKKLPASSSDSKLTSSSSPKISKPSSAVRSKPSAATNSLSSSDKVTSSAATATNTPVATAASNRRKMSTDVSLTRPAQGGSSKRAGSQSAGAKSNKQNLSKSPSARRQQPCPAMSSSSSNVSSVSYANAVKSSPSSQDKKPSTANKPVAYVKPTASTIATTAPGLSDQQEEESLSRMPSFPTAQLSQELMPEEPVIVTSSVEQQVKVTSEPTVVVAPSPAPPAFVSPVVSKSSSPAAPVVTAVSKSSRLLFTPFTFVASPSTTGVTNHQASIVQVTTVTSTVTSHPAQRGNGDTGKEGVAEVEEVATKRIRLGPVQRTNNVTDHSTKLNISAVPFIPSCIPATVTSHQKSNVITTATAAKVTMPSVAATPFCKVSMPAACYQLPAGSMMPANMVPLIMPHPQMGSGYAMSQQTPYPFHTGVPSHAYPMPAHPPSIVGLAYAGYPMQQAAMVPPAVTNSGIPPSGAAPSYNMYVSAQPVSGANVIPPRAAPPFPPPPAAVVAAHHARMEQCKKEEQMKAVNDTKRFFEQSAASSSVAKQQPPLYKYPAIVKQQLPVTTEGGRRTLLENPPVPMAMTHPVGHMMNRPVEMTINKNNPSTGSKRKRRPPLLPQIPVTNNVTMTTPWDKPINTMY